jgi:hypothetical protein
MAIPRDRMDDSRAQEGAGRIEEAQVSQLYAPDDSWLTDPEFHALVENARTSHRHGKVWKLSEEGASEMEWRDWKPFAIAIVGMVAFWAWLVWG